MRTILQVTYSYIMLTSISINKRNSPVDLHRTSDAFLLDVFDPPLFDPPLLIDLLFSSGICKPFKVSLIYNKLHNLTQYTFTIGIRVVQLSPHQWNHQWGNSILCSMFAKYFKNDFADLLVMHMFHNRI